MALPFYLAMTAWEMESCPLPQKAAYMACHFSSYGAGLHNIPHALPAGSLLILNDRIPVWEHDPVLVARQLAETAEELEAEAVLLDFQRPGEARTAAITQAVLAALSCPMAVTQCYAEGLSCPVFLPPPPLYQEPREYFAPWEGREIWLEAALESVRFTVTREASVQDPLPYEVPEEPRHTSGQFACTYHIDVLEDRAVFTLSRTREDLKQLLCMAEDLGITRAVGLYQQLGQEPP